MTLYLALNLGSLIIPLIYSFHPKVRFYTKFKAFIPAMLISAVVYLSWDVLFTKNGIWGFNHRYLLGWDLMGLPLEEWMFFICIPYACVFTHYTLTSIFPQFSLGKKTANYLHWFLIILLVIVVAINSGKSYTLYNGLLSLAILVSAILKIPKVLRQFYLTFLIILIPFFIVNGVLTGSFIEEEVVWYNDAENLGIRLFTIPVEDIFYAFGLILLNIFLTELFTKKSKSIREVSH